MATWLTLEEAAKQLKTGKSTIYRLAREGDLPARRMGRVWRCDAEETDDWLKARKHALCNLLRRCEIANY